MKKLMLIVAVVATAFAANAASFAWSAAAGRLFDGEGTATANRINGATAYLFDAGVVSQSSLVEALVAGSVDLSAGALDHQEVSAGRVQLSATPFTYGVTSDFTAYFAVLVGDNLYISDTTTAGYMAVGDGEAAFGSQNAFSSAGFKDAAQGYAGAGWYQAGQAAPEPTSGLLLLLGMAGLALKRKIA